VVDALLLGSAATQTPDPIQSQMSRDVLSQLRKLIRNKKLNAMLGEKIEKAEQNQQRAFDFSHGDSSGLIDPDTQQQLQFHGFDFSQPLRASASPHSSSIASDVSYHPPVPVQNQLGPAANRSPFHHQSENWAHPQQPSQQTQGQNTMWDSALQPSPGPGFDMTQELFNQLQGFNQDMNAFGMDTSLDSGHFDSEWADEPSSTNQLSNLLPVTPWQQAPGGSFNP
jgi:hypothetical protein